MLEPVFTATPADVGIDEEKLDELRRRVHQEVDSGLLPAAQFALAKDGKVVAFESVGSATNNSLFCVFSATKAITSAAGWLLLEAGQLDTDERVAEIIPEFAANGKDAVTVGQLFTHTAGFPSAPFRTLDWLDKNRRLERWTQWRLNFEPGTQFMYHPTSSMWVIAELIERRSGIAFIDFARQRIIEPLALHDLLLGVPAEAVDRVMPNQHVGEAMTPQDYAELGLPVPPVTEVTEGAIQSFNRPEILAVGAPGGGAVSSAADLALFYQGLLHGGAVGREQIWSEAMLAEARRNWTGDLRDPLYGHQVGRGLGICVAGDENRNRRGFGHSNSDQAFGHNGAGGQIAWADPATGLSFAYCTNGHDRHAVRQARRSVSISNRAAVCAAAA